MKFEHFVEEVAREHSELAGLAKCNNLDGAFRFLSKLGFSVGDMDIVSQDEFTLDLVFPFPQAKLFLVLGVT